MARIPEDELERLKKEISVEHLVEASGVALKRTGKDLLGCCPYHDDRKASLVVSPEPNLWHCFGCQAGGGPIDWVMKANGVSFRHAVELLRADPSLGVPGMTHGMVVEVHRRRRLNRRQAKRKADPPVRAALKEARSRAASRRTETRYEANRAGASEPMIAKLLQPRAWGVDWAVAR